MTMLTQDDLRQEVQKRYARLADEFKIEVSAADCCGSGNACCDQEDPALASLYGDLYTADTSWLPDEVTGLSLGCGDPITLAGLQPGQTVLDLGSGGGIDCFMAARQVGPTGHVIGVDMTPSMLAKAERNKAAVNLGNVEFRRGFIENLPVADASVDVAISNCVINLSPDKAAVFREVYRVLKPGGRLAVSDMVTRGRFTPEERANVSAWAGCVSGAEDVADYVAAMRAAGFGSISVVDKTNPGVELSGVAPESGPAQLFSARITAVKEGK